MPELAPRLLAAFGQPGYPRIDATTEGLTQRYSRNSGSWRIPLGVPEVLELLIVVYDQSVRIRWALRNARSNHARAS
jgi:hypothetical protein